MAGICGMEPLYLDNHLLVLDKPWGLLTQPSGTDEDSLEARGKAFLKERFAKPGAVFLEAIHRIDRVVGGVVLFARTSKGLERLNGFQREKRIRKTYRARVSGMPGMPAGVLEDFLVHDDFCARVVPEGTPGSRRCRLEYRVLETGPRGTLLKIALETGRYHQIRAQLAHAGMPICGDRKYGASESSLSQAPSGGIALLSWKLEFPHPVSREEIELCSRLTL